MNKKYSFNIEHVDYEGRYRVNVRDERGGTFELDEHIIDEQIKGLNEAAYAEDNKDVVKLEGLVKSLMQELAEIKAMIGSKEADINE